MLKTLFLQGMYNLPDESMEKELHDRISFRNFLHYPEILLDSRTIWLFRERLSSTGTDKKIWKHIWKQFEDQGIVIRKGAIQDATFIESDSGKYGNKKPSVDPIPPELRDVTPEKMTTKAGKREAKIRASEKKRLRKEERRSKDGKWAKKNSAAHFGNKLHTVQGTDIPLIREFVVTTASLHDSQIDLSIPAIPFYREKGYLGAQCRGSKEPSTSN